MQATGTNVTAKDVEVHLETARLRLGKILVATDFSRYSHNALKVATVLARQFDSELLLVHSVMPIAYSADPAVVVPETPFPHLDIARANLQAEIDGCNDLKGVKHQEIIEVRALIDLVNDLVERERVGLIVAGSHGASGIEKLALGSTAEAILRHTACPVLVVGPNYSRTTWACKSILFATDLTIGAFRPAQYAAALAEELNADLTLLHLAAPARNGEPEETNREALKMRLRELLPKDAEDWCRVKTRVEYGEAAKDVVAIAVAEKADLILLGVSEHGPLADHAPWGTLTNTIRYAKCPVLAVRGHLYDLERRPQKK
ncbi:MAG: universal stress protein [Acidobacteriaceae bacterium]